MEARGHSHESGYGLSNVHESGRVTAAAAAEIAANEKHAGYVGYEGYVGYADCGSLASC